MKSILHSGHGIVSPSVHGAQAHFKVAMHDVYDYSIVATDFDPETIYPEIITLGNHLSEVLQKQLTLGQQTSFEDHILNCLADMVYGSNMIEHAGNSYEVTLKLCMAIFRDGEIGDAITEDELLELGKYLQRKNLPANLCAVLQIRREIVQHAKAALYIMNQLCIHDQDLSEEIILQTHRILTYKVDAGDTPWKEYSGVYRTDEVSAGFHSFPHHSLVPHKMKAMIRELKSDLNEALKMGTIDPIAIASKYTHIFVNVHPFIDGNGRMCRLILNSLLLKLGSFIVCIGGKDEDRSLYLEIAAKSSALEDLYEDLEEKGKPFMYKELGSFVLSHVGKSMYKLIDTLL
jgi:Fic family protein